VSARPAYQQRRRRVRVGAISAHDTEFVDMRAGVLFAIVIIIIVVIVVVGSVSFEIAVALTLAHGVRRRHHTLARAYHHRTSLHTARSMQNDQPRLFNECLVRAGVRLSSSVFVLTNVCSDIYHGMSPNIVTYVGCASLIDHDDTGRVSRRL
jgi:hypothetical protein